MLVLTSVLTYLALAPVLVPIHPLEQRPISREKLTLDEFFNPVNTDLPTTEPPVISPYSPGKFSEEMDLRES